MIYSISESCCSIATSEVWRYSRYRLFSVVAMSFNILALASRSDSRWAEERSEPGLDDCLDEGARFELFSIVASICASTDLLSQPLAIDSTTLCSV
jgi:hypothetical protein